MTEIPGYANKILRVDLSHGKIQAEVWDEVKLRQYLGGTCLGAAVIYDEVPAGTRWSDPGNRLILASGPLTGTRVKGSSTISVVTLGAMTGGTAATQANGYFSAFLKCAGFDAIIIQGRAERLSYLYVHDGSAEIRDACGVAGLDTWETEDALKQELGFKPSSSSVLCIGPAGENLVRFAGIFGDKGHAAAHNGVGAVMGSKNLKAVVVARGDGRVKVYDNDTLIRLSNELFAKHQTDEGFKRIYNWGTLGLFKPSAHLGRLPYKNYTTSVCPMTEAQLETFGAEYLRAHFDIIRPHPCWGCQMHHCTLIHIPNGPLAGREGEEPEFEGYTSVGSQLGVYDGMTVTSLSNEVDRLGLDVNETGWTLGLAMECYEKGLINRDDTDGVELTWGNLDAIRAMLDKIVRRDGFGDTLAEGAMRVARQIGGEALEFAIHTRYGNTPIGHDHRPSWNFLFDISVANTGSYELHIAPRPHLMDMKQPHPDSPEDVVEYISRTKWLTQFFDSLGICRLANREFPDLLVGLVNAATGWDFTRGEAELVGLRALSLMRAFNLRHGFQPGQDAPSSRYGSIPVDGPHQGRDVSPHWEKMLDIYYRNLGWDRATGKPLPETLRRLGLEQVAAELWPG